MPHPLKLPEIRDLIGAYLGTKDLINCACVSREWNSTFSTLIWQHLNLKLCGSFREPRPNLTVAQIQAHSSDIRSLTMAPDIPDEYYLLENLHRLHSLHVKCRPYQIFHSILPLPVILPLPAVLPFLANLIENHSLSLRNFEIHVGTNHLSPPTFKAIGMCRQLKSLSLNHVDVSQEELTSLLVACANIGQRTDEELRTDALSKGGAGGLITLCLESFNARNCESTPFSTLAPLSYLEHLRIGTIFGMVSEAQLKLLMLCPNLRSLYWRRYERGCKFLMDEWVNHIESGMWLQLTSLDVSGEEFHDRGLSRFIEGLPLSLEKLLVERTGFATMAFNSLISTERHYSHIQELEIHGCKEVESHMIQKFMTTMPALRYFSADLLRATDILDAPGLDSNGDDHGQEWICKNIRTLRLCIDMGLEFDPSSSEYAERQRQVYRRLSALKLVETLDVCRGLVYQRDRDVRRLDFRLSTGLGQLAPLGQIREFLFAPEQSMTLEDVEWMISTWRSLVAVSRHMNCDKMINMSLMKSLAKQDIKTIS